MGKKKKLGLVPKLIIGIILGILIGSFCPEIVCRIVVTASGLFSTFLKFVIPMMILAYVTMGIADLSQGAGKLLAITAARVSRMGVTEMLNREATELPAVAAICSRAEASMKLGNRVIATRNAQEPAIRVEP